MPCKQGQYLPVPSHCAGPPAQERCGQVGVGEGYIDDPNAGAALL